MITLRNHYHRTPLAAILLLSVPFLASAPSTAQTPSQARAIWFWQSPNSPFGSDAIVGNVDREDQTITRFKSLGIVTVYGSYSVSTSSAKLRTWNRKLAKNGISSFLLLSETEYLFPENWPAAEHHLQTSLIQFNRGSAPSDRFSGLSFDIEPHIFAGSKQHAGWKASDPLLRREYMDDFLHFFQHTRALLAASADPSTLIEATLPAWYGNLPDSIQWANALDRDTWFAALSKACDRLSIMAFEVSSTATILQRSKEELDHLQGKGRIALRANLGKEWQTPEQFWRAVREVEAAGHQGIEIQDFALIAAQDAPSPGPQK